MYKVPMLRKTAPDDAVGPPLDLASARQTLNHPDDGP
jgi:hypothetical protein